jgi:GLEYA domain
MSLNGISTLANKQLRQIAKLNLAESDRDRVGNPRAAYDIDRLPTKYSTNSIVDNPNAGGLLQGRPWVSLEAGVYQYHFSGYWNNTVSNITGATPTGSGLATNFEIPSQPSNRSELFMGYLKSDYTGTWTFTMTSDDGSVLWIGPNAANGYTLANSLIRTSIGTVTGTVDLVAGSYYPIRLIYGNGPAGGSLTLNYSHTGQSNTTNYTGKLFYNPITNGI